MTSDLPKDTSSLRNFEKFEESIKQKKNPIEPSSDEYLSPASSQLCGEGRSERPARTINGAQFQNMTYSKRIKKISAQLSSLIRKYMQNEESEIGNNIGIQQTQKQIQELIEKFMNNIAELDLFRKVLLKTVNKLQIYDEVLERIIANSTEFCSVEDYMSYCFALLLSKLDLTALYHQKLEEINKIRKELIKTENYISTLSLSDLSGSAERCFENVKAEKELTATKAYITEIEIMQSASIAVVNNMYKMLCKRNGVEPSFTYDAVEQQLDYIKKETEILDEVEKICMQKMMKIEEKM